MTREAQVRALGRLAGEALGSVVRTVADVHAAVNRRVTAALPPPARPIAGLTTASAHLVYAGVERALRATPELVARPLARRPGPPLVTHPGAGGHLVRSVNGLWGDTIAAHHRDLAIRSTLRVEGVDGRLREVHELADLPEPTARVVVFVHGLTQGDGSWSRRWTPAADGETGHVENVELVEDLEQGEDGDQAATPISYGARLRADLGYTPAYFHYNSGLAVLHNAELLARSLAELERRWPVPIERIALIGHSMGGLIACAACQHAELAGYRWPDAVGPVITLSTPHLGAPLEQAVHLGERILGGFAESAPLGRLLGSRSAGVRDLRWGLPTAAAGAGVRYYFASASIAVGGSPLAGWLLGDGLVRASSATASGRGREDRIAPQRRAHFAGLHHMAVLNHPDVYAQLRQWCE